jgi:adenylate kinase
MQSLSLVTLVSPGAGKGTQNVRLTHERSLLQISTGAILRDEMSMQTDAGLAVRSRMDAGLLVDDAVILATVRDHLSNLKSKHGFSKHGFVLDGFPPPFRKCSIK